MNKGNEMENLIKHRLNEMKEVERSEEEKKEWERIITFFFFFQKKEKIMTWCDRRFAKFIARPLLLCIDYKW